MCQQDEEKFEDFVKKIKRKVKKCGYTADTQEEALKDRIIYGIGYHQISQGRKYFDCGNGDEGE